jgi:hypothetical protein
LDEPLLECTSLRINFSKTCGDDDERSHISIRAFIDHAKDGVARNSDNGHINRMRQIPH